MAWKKSKKVFHGMEKPRNNLPWHGKNPQGGLTGGTVLCIA
jgi:hypothetical protein